jgi:hypothetical protein
VTDLACWRLHTSTIPAFVIRVYGREFTLREEELGEFIDLLVRVRDGDEEALSEGYRELCADAEAPRIDIMSLISASRNNEPKVTRR